MTRSPQDVFTAHAAALASGDISKIVEDYSAEAVLLTPQGPIEGRDGIGEFFAGALAALPEAEFTTSLTIFAADALLPQWSATSAGNRDSARHERAHGPAPAQPTKTAPKRSSAASGRRVHDRTVKHAAPNRNRSRNRSHSTTVMK